MSLDRAQALGEYSKGETPISYAQRSSVKVNPKNPMTIIKPLRPNILDQMAIDSVNWLAAQKRRSGLKWKPVQQL
jgi:hypothetical protein